MLKSGLKHDATSSLPEFAGAAGDVKRAWWGKPATSRQPEYRGRNLSSES
jgi:hypothetical protein